MIVNSSPERIPVMRNQNRKILIPYYKEKLFEFFIHRPVVALVRPEGAKDENFFCPSAETP
jgi:hypothetical protein